MTVPKQPEAAVPENAAPEKVSEQTNAAAVQAPDQTAEIAQAQSPKPVNPDIEEGLDAIYPNSKPAEEAPGVAFANEDAQDAADAAAAKRSRDQIEFLSVQQLIEEIQAAREALNNEEGEKHIRSYIDALNTGFKQQFVVPKVAADAPVNNGQLFLNVIDGLQTKPNDTNDGLVTKALQGLKLKSVDANATIFGTTSGSGNIHITDKGIHFHAVNDSSKKATGKFTEVEARQIALLVMHNKDMLPPNAIRLTGTKEQKALIQSEIEKLSATLPEGARPVLSAKKEPSFWGASAPFAKQAAAPETTSAKTKAPAQQSTESEEKADDVEAAAKDSSAETTVADTPPAEAPVSGNVEANNTSEQQAPPVLDLSAYDMDGEQDQAARDRMEELLNQYPDMTQNAEAVTIYPNPEGVSAFKVRMQEPSSELSEMKDVIFTQEENRLKVQTIEGDDVYARLTTKPVQKTETKLSGDFDTVRQDAPAGASTEENPQTPAPQVLPKADGPGQHIA